MNWGEGLRDEGSEDPELTAANREKKITFPGSIGQKMKPVVAKLQSIIKSPPTLVSQKHRTKNQGRISQ